MSKDSWKAGINENTGIIFSDKSTEAQRTAAQKANQRIFEEFGEAHGWLGVSEGFDPTAVAGEFGASMKAQLYQPTIEGFAGKMYTPEYELPWLDTWGGVGSPGSGGGPSN